MGEYIFNLAEVGMREVPLVGGKNASSGELIRSLSTVGIRIPQGFAVSAQGYRDLLTANELQEPITCALAALKKGQCSLSATGASIREMIGNAALPAPLASAICGAYRELATTLGRADPPVAVRSSATAEDLPEASFAGQQESYLNVTGEKQLLSACQRCYASLFTDRAIAYRQAKGIDDLAVALSIGVQEMVRSDIGASGVMFSLDPDSGFPRVVVINAAWGLGEAIVQGAVDPDKYMVFKPLLNRSGPLPLIEKDLGSKQVKVVLDEAAGGTKTVETKPDEQRAWALSPADLFELSRWALLVEEHYGRAMDMEWAKDGATGELFMVQARPETVHSGAGSRLIQYKMTKKAHRLLEGQAVGTSIAAGKACVIADTAEVGRFEDGAILVTRRTDPDWTPIMKRAAAIVTEHGGTTSHAAIISRELASRRLSGSRVQLQCSETDRRSQFRARRAKPVRCMRAASISRATKSIPGSFRPPGPR